MHTRREFVAGGITALLLPARAQTIVGVGAKFVPGPPSGLIACGQASLLSGAFTDSTNNSLNSRLHCVAPPGGLTSLFLAFPGFGENNPEVILPNGYTATAAIEYPAGTFTPIKFGGASSVTVFPGFSLWYSDTVSISIPGGATFWVKSYVTWTGTMWLDNQLAATLTDEWTNRGVGLSDNTQTVTVFSSTDGTGFAPAVLSSNYSGKAVGAIGDSICFAPDEPSPLDASRFVGRAMRQQVPVINLGKNGDEFSFYVPAHLGRRALLRGRVSSLVSEFGTNDTFLGSMTLATLQSNAQAAWAEYLNDGIKVWQTTLTPRTTSTDNWATTVNQTIVSSTAETMRLAFNSWLRSNYQSLGLNGYIDVAHAVDPTDSGLWSVDGAAGTNAAGFCTLSGGAVSACSLASYVSGSSAGSGYPASSTVPCIVYGYPGETGTLPTITAATNGSGVVTGFNIVAAGSGLQFPPMVAPQGQWTVDGTHPNARGYNAIISSTGLAPSLFS